MADRGPAVQDIREGMQQMRDDANGIKAVLERMERERGVRNNATQNVRVEGMGSLWHGIAIGISLGASIVASAWVASTLNRLSAEQLQNEAYISATYQAVPALREHFDKIKAEEAQHE